MSALIANRSDTKTHNVALDLADNLEHFELRSQQRVSSFQEARSDTTTQMPDRERSPLAGCR